MSVPALARNPRILSLPTILAGAGGAIYGLACARALYESGPLWLTAHSGWPATIILGAVGAAAGAALSLVSARQVPSRATYAAWAPLALALPLPAIIAPDVNPLRSAALLAGAPILAALLAILPPGSKKAAGWTQFAPAGIVFVITFGLYLRTLAPAVGEADTFEFQVGIARLGIAHGSGYPLLMLVGRLFTLLPVGGTLAFRANLTSAFFGALAAVGVERLCRRLGASPMVGLLAGLTFGLSSTLWSRATSVEAYTLNAFFVCVILEICLSLLSRDDDVSASIPPTGEQLKCKGRGGFARRLYWLCAVFGLSLTNHLTTLLLAPACLAAVLGWAQRAR